MLTHYNTCYNGYYLHFLAVSKLENTILKEYISVPGRRYFLLPLIFFFQFTPENNYLKFTQFYREEENSHRRPHESWHYKFTSVKVLYSSTSLIP